MTRTKLQNPYSNVEYIGTTTKGSSNTKVKADAKSSVCDVGDHVQSLPEPKPESKPESRAESVTSPHSVQLELGNEPCEVTSPSSSRPASRMAGTQSPLGSRPPTNISEVLSTT